MKKIPYDQLATERGHPKSRRLDLLTSTQVVRLMNAEDATVVRAVRAALPAIARAIEAAAVRIQRGGRLFIVGAGTSGRLGVLEAAECPPTFDTPPSLVQAIMAGGKQAVFRSQEGAEDNERAAAAQVRSRVRAGDVVVGVAASGVTAFAATALREAKKRRALAILITCNPAYAQSAPRDILVGLKTGPEILTGSTRLKAGTACKMALNMLTTGTMIKLGKVYRNWMVDLQPKSRKLVARGLRLVQQLGGVSESRAQQLFDASGRRVKVAIVMARQGLSRPAAERALAKVQGHLGRLIG